MSRQPVKDRYPRVTFRLGELQAVIGARQGSHPDSPKTPNEVVQRDLRRYYGLLSQVLPSFSEKEALLILRAVSLADYAADYANRMPMAGRPGGGRGRVDEELLWALVDMATAEGVQMKVVSPQDVAGVDTGALVKRLRALDPAKTLAVSDAVEQALILIGQKEKNPREAVRLVGLVSTREGR